MELADKTFLVTGGAGFIGSHLVDRLLALGARVRVMDNLANGTVDNLSGALRDPHCEFVEADIATAAATHAVFSQIDAVLHLACLGVRHSIAYPVENHRVNAEGTLNLLEICRARGVRRFLQCSTSEIYGTATTVPMNEAHPARPHTVYGASKLAGEAYARAYHDCFGLDVTIVRPFNTYGPRSHYEGNAGEAIPKFIVRALGGRELLVFGDGSNSRDFTFVEDVAAAMVSALLSEKLSGLTFNVGTGKDISLTSLAETIIALCGNPRATIRYMDPRPGDVRRLQADVTEFTKVAAWTPRVDLKEGLTRTVAYFKEHPLGLEAMLSRETGRNWE